MSRSADTSHTSADESQTSTTLDPSLDPNPTPAETTAASASTTPQAPLPLPLPTTAPSPQLDLSTGAGTVKLDHMGPLVVNKDGTLSRIANWESMAEIERQNTLRILGKRNQLRREGLAESAKREANKG